MMLRATAAIVNSGLLGAATTPGALFHRGEKTKTNTGPQELRSEDEMEIQALIQRCASTSASDI